MTKIGYPLLLVSDAEANIVNLVKIGSLAPHLEQGSALAVWLSRSYSSN